MPAPSPVQPTAEALRAAFDAPSPFTVGLEEEVMVLHPETLDLLPRAPELLPRLDGDARVKLELPAAQATLAEAGAVAAVAQALCAELAARWEAGERLAPVPTWRIEENRWSAARHGSGGDMADLVTGARAPTAERLHALVEALAPRAAELGCGAELAHAHVLVDAPGWRRQRTIARESGVKAVVEDLAARFAPSQEG